MGKYTRRRRKQRAIYVGVDLHQRSWHVTILAEAEDLFSGGIPSRWQALRFLLERYPASRVHVAYEAGYFGFWLYEEVKAHGADCTVTPPTLLSSLALGGEDISGVHVSSAPFGQSVFPEPKKHPVSRCLAKIHASTGCHVSKRDFAPFPLVPKSASA